MEASAGNPAQIAELKRELRRRYREERALLNSSGESWSHILGATEFQSAYEIASYISYGDEPETSDIHQELLDSGKNLYLPRLLPTMELEWVAWGGDQSQLVASRKNLREPIGPAIDPRTIEIFIIPALHISHTGQRLGQGGGSYDRTLAQSGAWKIALVHSGEISGGDLPVESHDQSVNAAATPALITRFH